MLGLLSLSVCIACISCLCCLCTATVVAAPGLIDLRTGLLLCGSQRRDGFGRKSEEIIGINSRKNHSNHSDDTNDGNASESCPCAITYVLDPILKARNSRETCDEATGKRKHCQCPSFLDLVGDARGPSGRVLPRS